MTLTPDQRRLAAAIAVDPETAVFVTGADPAGLFDPAVMIEAARIGQAIGKASAAHGNQTPLPPGSAPAENSTLLDTLPHHYRPLQLLADPRNSVADVASETGLSESTVRKIAANPHYKEAIQRYREITTQIASVEAGVTLGEVVARLRDIAFFDVRRLFDENGSLLPVHDLDPVASALIDEIEVQEIWSGRGIDRHQIGELKKIKLGKKLPALDMLMKHLGGYEADNRQKVNPILALVQAFASRDPSRNQLRPIADVVEVDDPPPPGPTPTIGFVPSTPLPPPEDAP